MTGPVATTLQSWDKGNNYHQAVLNSVYPFGGKSMRWAIVVVLLGALAAAQQVAEEREVNRVLTDGDPVVVAPAGAQSGVSHAVTWHEGVRIEPRGDDRDEAIAGLADMLDEVEVWPVRTNAGFLFNALLHPAFVAADTAFMNSGGVKWVGRR